jgi:tRNA-dihydrouridine synthase
MAELSHRPLRELILGFDRKPPVEFFTEMISAGGLLGGGPFERWYMDAGPCPGQVVYQLMGADPAQLEKAAALLDQKDCRGIDINMGCAAPAIRRTGAGIAWMADIDRAASLMGGVRKLVRHRRLSVKLRVGFSDDLDYLVRFCRRLEAEGVELITLHPRIAAEKFKRRPRWEYVDVLRRELKIPVAGNGDIATAEELLRRSGEGPVMAGRALVRRPWLFAEAHALAAAADVGTLAGVGTATGFGSVNLEETALRFLGFLAAYQPPEFHLSRARRFFSYFCDNLTWGNYVKTLLNREESLGGIENAWQGYFAEHPEERYSRD